MLDPRHVPIAQWHGSVFYAKPELTQLRGWGRGILGERKRKRVGEGRERKGERQRSLVEHGLSWQRGQRIGRTRERQRERRGGREKERKQGIANRGLWRTREGRGGMKEGLRTPILLFHSKQRSWMGGLFNFEEFK